MGIFKNFFTNVKTNIVRSIVESKLNKIEDQLRRGEAPLSFIISKMFNLYADAYNKLITKTTKVVSNNKNDITDIITENYETINKIVELTTSLNTERNRQLAKSIINSVVETLKSVNDEMQDDFEKSVDTVNDSVCKLKDIWEIKPKSTTKKTYSDINDTDIIESRRVYRDELLSEHRIDFLKGTYGEVVINDLITILTENPAVDMVHISYSITTNKVVRLQGDYKRMVKI